MMCYHKTAKDRPLEWFMILVCREKITEVSFLAVAGTPIKHGKQA